MLVLRAIWGAYQRWRHIESNGVTLSEIMLPCRWRQAIPALGIEGRLQTAAEMRCTMRVLRWSGEAKKPAAEAGAPLTFSGQKPCNECARVDQVQHGSSRPEADHC